MRLFGMGLLNPKFQAFSSFLCLYRSVCVGPVRKPHCWFSHEAAHITRTYCDKAGDYAVPNVLSPRDLVFRLLDKNCTHTHM